VANRLSRRLRIVVLATAFAAAAVVVPTVSSVEKELSKLAVQNTQLVESYNEAQIAVTARQKAAANAEKSVKTADAALTAAHVSLSRSALAEYEGGSFTSAGALLSSNSGTSYLDQLDTAQMITTHSAQVMSSYSMAQKAAASAQDKADEFLASATKTRDQLASQKKTVQAQVKKYSALLATLTAAQRKVFQNTMNPVASSVQRTAAMQEIPNITSDTVRKAVAFAVAQVGKPYSYGAAGPGSYDCSGLTMSAYRAAGVSLPHSAADQYNYGHHVAFSDLQPGDLMFFYRPRIGHVTMYIGDGLMVSAPETGELVKIIPAGTFGNAYVGATRLVSS
jgi:cell wall-associated NlpC family hydrolase